MLSFSGKKKYKAQYELISSKNKIYELEKRRMNKLNKRNLKIQQAQMNLQEVEPMFLDALIADYHRKENVIEDRVEIFKEIQKYDCPESIRFFQKINDSEINNQVKKMAFVHLQQTNLVSEYTREVFKKRMIQSRQFLLVKSKNPGASEWIRFELDFYSENCSKAKMYITDYNMKYIDITKFKMLYNGI